MFDSGNYDVKEMCLFIFNGVIGANFFDAIISCVDISIVHVLNGSSLT